MVCWSRVGTKLCRAAALQELSLTPLLYVNDAFNAYKYGLQMETNLTAVDKAIYKHHTTNYNKVNNIPLGGVSLYRNKQMVGP